VGRNIIRMGGGQKRVITKWEALVLAVLNLWVLLPEMYFILLTCKYEIPYLLRSCLCTAS